MNNQSLVSRVSTFLSISIISCSAFFISSCSSGGGTSSFTVGGTVNGTSDTVLVLQLNAANDLSLDSNSTFSFTTSLASGSSYSVTVLTAPTGQTCRVTNGSGTISANVTNVSVECLTNEDPNGYYINTGSADVGGALGTLNITDLQAIIYDNRFMAMSVSTGLLYDGPLEMFGDELTAMVSVFKDGLLIHSNVNLTATVTANDSISGTLSGTQEGAGTFNLVHSMDPSLASISRINRDYPSTWASPLGNSTTDSTFTLSNTAAVAADAPPIDGDFQGCGLYSHNTAVAFIPVGTSLYQVTVQIGDCSNVVEINTNASQGGTAGIYTGYATSRSDTNADDTLVFMVTSASGQYAVAEDFK